MFGCNIGNQFLDQDGLANSCAAEKANLTALGIWGQQIDDLDACLQHLHHRALVLKGRRVPVDDPFILIVQVLSPVNGFTKDIEQPAQGLLSYRYLDACPGRFHLHILT